MSRLRDATYRSQVEAFTSLLGARGMDGAMEKLKLAEVGLSPSELQQLQIILTDAQFLGSSPTTGREDFDPPSIAPELAGDSGWEQGGLSPLASRDERGQSMMRVQGTSQMEAQSMQDMQEAVREMPPDLNR